MTVFVIDLESVQTRYTCEWKTYLPEAISKTTNSQVRVVSGDDTNQTTTPGAFLNFSGTNVYKSQQLQQIAELFEKGEVQNGDYFLYTDAWNPTVIQLKYMASLLGVNIRIGGLWHAGSYDPNDFLGRLIGDRKWVRHSEKSMFYCYDDNFFATEFHIDMFAKQLFDEKYTESFKEKHPSVKRVGWPMEYLTKDFQGYHNTEKRDLILFPHRLAPEKQVEIFKDLANSIPEYEFVVCQETPLTKPQYHRLLAESKMVFSANLQETLGISTCIEAPLMNSIPLCPDRLSYSEIFENHTEFLYPSEWSEDWASYQSHKDELIEKIKSCMNNHTNLCNQITDYLNTQYNRFFAGDDLYSKMKN